MSYVLIEKKNVASCSCSLSISLPRIFTLPFAKISHFLTNSLKFSCSVADEAFLIYFYLWLQIFLYLLSRSMLVLSLLSTSAQTLKCSRKKTWLCCRFFSLKVQVAKMTITRTFIIKLNAGCSLHTKLKRSFHINCLPFGEDGRAYGLMTSKISRMHGQPNFLTVFLSQFLS